MVFLSGISYAYYFMEVKKNLQEVGFMKLIRRSDFARPTLFGDLFDDFFRTDIPAVRSMMPAIDIVEEKDHYTIKADLPGMNQKDIKVELDEGVLRISGERNEEKKEQDKDNHYRYYERSFGSFERRFVLPREVKEDAIEAKYENGVLKITIPKAETRKAKEIAVK